MQILKKSPISTFASEREYSILEVAVSSKAPEKPPCPPKETPSEILTELPTCFLPETQIDFPTEEQMQRVQEAFPELEIIKCIGQGGMGVVYKARQPKLDRLVALKLLPAELSSNPDFSQRFKQEALTLAQLNHPNIVALHEFNKKDDQYYLIMEFVDGTNLRQTMAFTRFSADLTIAIVSKLCDALQAAHDKGIQHRDIKPENILLDQNGEVKIVDFGIAKYSNQNNPFVALTRYDEVIGSKNYMAPEQITSKETIDHRADIYSVGVVFYEMLTGELPIGRFLPPSEKSDSPEHIDFIVMRALESEVDRRYQNVSEIKTHIQSPPSKNSKPYPQTRTKETPFSNEALSHSYLLPSSPFC